MVMSRVRRALSIPSLAMREPPPEWVEDPVALYRVLRSYYHGNDLYAALQTIASDRGVWSPAIKGLRNPAHRVVEFYVAHLWPSDFELVTTNDAIVEPLGKVWQWSNWDAKQRLAARWFSMLGDLFIKVVSQPTSGRVYLQLINPENVLDFDSDVRGFLTYLHIEVPIVVRDGDKTTPMVHTEIWDKAAGTYRRWQRDRRLKVDELGTPTETKPLSAFGIDFLPFVHALFQDVGNDRGAGAYLHALDKVDEANQQATRLHQMLYRNNKATWALQANGVDASGRPLPPPSIQGSGSAATADNGIVEIGDESFVRLPGTATLAPLVPNINFDAGLSILNAQLRELQDDLPELTFYRLADEGQLSGAAIRMKMTAGIDKIMEARGNGLQALIRANQMALTIGKATNIDGFGTVGAFDSGELDHSYAPRDPIAISEAERLANEQAKADVAIAQQQSGVSQKATLRDRGYSDEEIAQMELERDAEQQAAASRVLTSFNRGLA